MHANSPLTVRGRMMLVERIGSGRPIARVAAEIDVSRTTATTWWRWFQDQGPVGLEDRSSRPRRCPHRTPARVEAKILRLRRRRKLGPARISGIVDVPASTVHQVLTRAGMNRIARMEPDRPGDPADPHRPARRARPRGREVAGSDSSWRWVAHAWSGHRPAQLDDPGRLRLHPFGGRRAHPTRPTPRSVPTNEDRLAPASGRGPRPSSLTTTSASRSYSPTTPGTTSARTSLPPLGPIEHRKIRFRRPQTDGKVCGSTGPCSTSGPMSGSTGQHRTHPGA